MNTNANATKETTMKLFRVEHMRGWAGIDETEVEIIDDVEAESPEAAIREFTDWPDGKNPDATNRSGSYCDYWMATAQNEDDFNRQAEEWQR
jgi:hypothetical protein